LLPAKQRKRCRRFGYFERDSFVACPDPEEKMIMRIERILNGNLGIPRTLT
jgi:uncharacterized repeat protein (TIGR04076 family)